MKRKLTAEELDRIKNLISSYDLPTEIPKDLSAEELVNAISMDKKKHGDRIDLILPTDIGQITICSISLLELKKYTT